MSPSALRAAAGRGPEDAADVVAETFLVAWRRLGEVPNGAEARLWLHGVARRVIANLDRSGRRRTLRDEDRELLLLVSWEELAPSEAAKILGISSLAAVPDLAAFEERLGWLRGVDSQTWLDAMPPTVVKAADHDATVSRMLRDIPLPPGFDPGLIPDEGLTTDRGAVVGTVSCLWFRRWGDARRPGDRATRVEAERAMTSAPRWPVVRQMKQKENYPELLMKLVESMPSGVCQFGPHRWRVLPKAEGVGCARWERFPVLPWKQHRQSERRQAQPQRKEPPRTPRPCGGWAGCLRRGRRPEPGSERLGEPAVAPVAHPGDVAVGPDQHGARGGDRRRAPGAPTDRRTRRRPAGPGRPRERCRSRRARRG